jgi:uncharacterized protein YjeT (DUF2065 family)
MSSKAYEDAVRVLPTSSLIWTRWLVTVSVGVVLFGISMVLAPGLTRQVFSLLIYASPDHIVTFGSGAVAYLSLVHAILGAVMVSWGIALLFIVLGPFPPRLA